MGGSMGGMGPAAGGSQRPVNPRFSGQGQRAGAGMMGSGNPGQDATELDESAVLNWSYVGFDGKPLAADELESTPESKLMRFVPFRVRVQMDQRKLNELLAVFATAALPIDVRQVRINPGSVSQTGQAGADGMGMSMGGGPAFGGSMGGPDQRPSGGRAFDAMVEIRGSILVVRPPDPASLGMETDSEVSPSAPSAALQRFPDRLFQSSKHQKGSGYLRTGSRGDGEQLRCGTLWVDSQRNRSSQSHLQHRFCGESEGSKELIG